MKATKKLQRNLLVCLHRGSQQMRHGNPRKGEGEGEGAGKMSRKKKPLESKTVTRDEQIGLQQTKTCSFFKKKKEMEAAAVQTGILLEASIPPSFRLLVQYEPYVHS